MQRLTCPLTEFGCRRERCAWWDSQQHCCAVVTSMTSLTDIKQLLQETLKSKQEK